MIDLANLPDEYCVTAFNKILKKMITAIKIKYPSDKKIEFRLEMINSIMHGCMYAPISLIYEHIACHNELCSQIQTNNLEFFEDKKNLLEYASSDMTKTLLFTFHSVWSSADIPFKTTLLKLFDKLLILSKKYMKGK